MLAGTAAKARQLRHLLRLRPFDTSTEAGRSDERHRRALLAALASGLAKFITIASALVTIPLTLTYLGVERFGLWMTIASLIALMSFADMGLGNGLMNAVADADGKRDTANIRKFISSAFVALVAVALCVGTILAVAASVFDISGLLNVRSPAAASELYPSLIAFTIIFALSIPAGIVQKVQLGLQMGLRSSLWQAGGAALAFVAILLVVWAEGGVPWLVLASAGVPVLMLIASSLDFFSRSHRHLAPRLASVSRPELSRLLKVGLLFFFLQLSAALAFASDNLIIANVLGQAAVAEYSVVNKLFEAILLLLGVAVLPLWPAYAEAKARRDVTWIERTLIRTLLVTFFYVTSAGILLLMLGPWLLQIWVGGAVEYSLWLFAGFLLWTILKGLGMTHSMFMNGLGAIKSQLVLALLFAGTSLVLKWYFAAHFGLKGILLALILTYCAFVVFPLGIMTPKILSRLKFPPGTKVNRN